MDPYLAPYIRLNLKGIKDINVTPETIKPLEENTGRKLYDIGFGKDFLDMIPKAQVTIAYVRSVVNANGVT